MSAPTQAGIPPAALMMQIVNGKCVSRCVSLAADLAIADRLAEGPQDLAALAAATGTRPDALYRVLRMLAGVGIFSELPNRFFQNNTLSETPSSRNCLPRQDSVSSGSSPPVPQCNCWKPSRSDEAKPRRSRELCSAPPPARTSDFRLPASDF